MKTASAPSHSHIRFGPPEGSAKSLGAPPSPLPRTEGRAGTPPDVSVRVSRLRRPRRGLRCGRVIRDRDGSSGTRRVAPREEKEEKSVKGSLLSWSPPRRLPEEFCSMHLTMALSTGRDSYPPTPNLRHWRVVPVWGTFYNLRTSPMAGREGSPGRRGEPTHAHGTVHGLSADTGRPRGSPLLTLPGPFTSAHPSHYVHPSADCPRGQLARL